MAGNSLPYYADSRYGLAKKIGSKINMCVLRAYGEEFDVDQYINNSSLRAYSICRRGERRFPTSTGNTDCHEYSGLKITVSEKEWDDLLGQIGDAELFLNANSTALDQLVAYPKVEQVLLDFPLDLRIDGKTIAGQSDFLPPLLLKLAGNLGVGIELSLYSTDKSV